MPEATASADVRREMQDEIASCALPLLERPLGRRSIVDMDRRAVFDREAERVLRAEMEGTSLGALWSAPPAEREIEVVVMEAGDPSRRVDIRLLNTKCVLELKKQIALQLKHGSATDIVLTTIDGEVLSNEELLSSVEDEIAGGMTLSGPGNASGVA